jgi:ATP-dependent DNA ligase
LLERVPVQLYTFDLLHLGTRSLLDEPYTRRRMLVRVLGRTRLLLSAPAWPAFAAKGPSVGYE